MVKKVLSLFKCNILEKCTVNKHEKKVIYKYDSIFKAAGGSLQESGENFVYVLIL